ncbi:MAG: hypothetical protein RQ833_01805 [Sphingomonadaceae bacterium]|nr:hypothetical protein [Sphingomonadaceae bacterium]
MRFVPASDAMRADRRFPALCDGIRLMNGWKQRGVTADVLKR